jgi:hypothetical protein
MFLCLDPQRRNLPVLTTWSQFSCKAWNLQNQLRPVLSSVAEHFSPAESLQFERCSGTAKQSQAKNQNVGQRKVIK